MFQKQKRTLSNIEIVKVLWVHHVQCPYVSLEDYNIVVPDKITCLKLTFPVLGVCQWGCSLVLGDCNSTSDQTSDGGRHTCFSSQMELKMRYVLTDVNGR